MNNEPVAWIDPKELDMDVSTSVTKNKHFESDIPLYTHPVEEQDESFDRTASHMAGEYVSYQKELTDEEIWEVVSLKWWDWEDSFDVTGFARAILRKASEK